MAVFKYKAKDTGGVVKEGVMVAANREEAGEKIRAQDLSPLTVSEVKKSGRRHGASLFEKKVSFIEKHNFCRYLATMINAGLPLTEAVETIAEGNTNPRMREVLTQVEASLQAGQPVSSAFSKFPDVFDEVFLTLVKAGEESGTMGKSFDYLGNQLYADYELTRKVKSTLAYPTVIILATGGLGVAMLVFVIPKIAPVLLRMNNEFPLPAYTIKILEVAMFFSQHIPVLIGSILGVGGLGFFLLQQPKVKKLLGNFFSRIPLVGRLFTQLALGRFNRTLATLLKSGVAITDSLQVAMNTLTLPQYADAKKIFVEEIQKGVSLATILRSAKVFPPMMCRMVATGEKTGALGQMLLNLAQFYEEEVSNSLKSLTSVIEPILMLLIGMGVGGMVISVIAPIYSFVGSLSSSLGGG